MVIAIETANAYDLVYDWFSLLKSKNNADVISYVIMPNHLHVIIYFHGQGHDLNTIVANGKRFMAYKILDRLKNSENNELLYHLQSLVTIREKKKGQVYKVFKDSFDAKPIFSQKFLIQKINYIHNNPVSGKWMLANTGIAYEHSSASFYEMYPVKHFTPVHFMNL